MAGLYERQGLYRKAVPLCQEVSQILIEQIYENFYGLSEKEKAQFLSTFKNNFEFYKSFVIKAQPHIPSLSAWLFDNTLITKGILLQSTQKIRNQILNGGDKALQNKLRVWQEKKNYLAKVYTLPISKRKSRGIDKLEKEVNDIEKELSYLIEKVQGPAGLTALFGDRVHYSWSDLKKQLQAKEAAITIIRANYYDQKWTDSVLYIALIVKPDTKMQPELIVLPNGNALESKYLHDYRKSTKYQEKTKDIYNQFWKPIKKKLKGVHKIYFSPDGVYNLINLNTLYNPSTNKYLLEEINIHLISNLKDLIHRRQPSTSSQSAVLLGRPNYDLEVQKHQPNKPSNQTRGLGRHL